MVSAVIGPVTFDGPQDFVDIGKAVMDALVVDPSKLLTSPKQCVYLPRLSQGPSWAEGMYFAGRRTAEVRAMRRRDGKPKTAKVFYTTAHELYGHGADHDKMQGKRRVAMAMMDPQPVQWEQTGGQTGMARYWQYPFENYANRMAEAVTGGKAKSPYDDDYTRWIEDADLPALVDLAAIGPADPTDTTPPPPDTIDPGTVDQLEAEVARLNTALAACNLALTNTRATLAEREAALTEARRLAEQIAALRA